jgi:hypothetical protein
MRIAVMGPGGVEAGLEAPVNRAVYAALKPFVNGSADKAS